MIADIKKELWRERLKQENSLLNYKLYQLYKQLDGDAENDNPLPYEEEYTALVTVAFKNEFERHLEEIINTGLFDRTFEVSYYPTAMPENVQTMSERLVDLLSRPFDGEWAATNREAIETMVNDLYYTSAVVGRTMVGVTDPTNFVFDLVDRGAIDQLDRIGVFWVSEGAKKHIVTDTVTRLAKDAIYEGMGLSEAGKMFKTELAGVAGAKSDIYYRNLASVVMNRARNISRINQFYRLKVTEVEWLGIPDARQCPTCMELDGSVFRVEQLIPTVERIIAAETPEGVINASPFISTIDADAGEFVLANGSRIATNSSSEALARLGIQPPAHPGCRCSLITMSY